MAALNIALLCVMAGELVVLIFTLSRLQDDMNKGQEKLASELSEIKKVLEK